MSKDLTEKINTLKEEHLPKVGRWEIAQNSEPFSTQCVGKMEAFDLTLIVHQESFFILNTYVSPPDEAQSGIRTFIEAVEEHRVLPEVLLVMDTKLFAELKPIAEIFDFSIIHTDKLKAVPRVLRDMARMLKR